MTSRLGLAAAHRRGIIHRDVKPQNILVGRDGSIRLTDFGIANVYKYIDTFRLTTTGMTLGTVQYMPPEQAQGDIVSPATDVYALGIVMYEMLTDHTPFDGDTPAIIAMQHIQDAPTPPSQFNPHIPPALEEIIMRCLEKAPEMRYRDGSQLARALEALDDAEFAQDIPYTPASLPAQGRIPARPAVSEHAPPQSEQLSTSAPTYILPDNDSYDHNRATGSPVPLVAFQPPLSLELQQSKVPPVGLIIGPSESSSTRPFVRGGTPPRDRRDSRFAAIVTVPILLATLLLLGFSFYLAVALGLINWPLFGNGGAMPTPALTSTIVPDLHGLNYTQANARATGAGFTLALSSGSSRQGIVQNQNRKPARSMPGAVPL